MADPISAWVNGLSYRYQGWFAAVAIGGIVYLLLYRLTTKGWPRWWR